MLNTKTSIVNVGNGDFTEVTYIDSFGNIYQKILTNGMEIIQFQECGRSAQIISGDKISADILQISDDPNTMQIVKANELHGRVIQIRGRELIKELQFLRMKMIQEVRQISYTPEHDIAIGKVVQAEKKLKAGNTEEAIGLLKTIKGKMKKWVVDIAKRIGANAISKLLGIF